MTRKAPSLADRRESLLQRSAAQRDELALRCGDVNAPLRRIDDSLAVVGRWISSPLLIGVALMLVVGFGRSRSLRTVGAGVSLLASVLRARSEAARLATRRD